MFKLLNLSPIKALAVLMTLTLPNLAIAEGLPLIPATSDRSLLPSSTAGWKEVSFSWGEVNHETGARKAATNLSPLDTNNGTLNIIAQIGHSSGGDKRLYILLHYMDNTLACLPQDQAPKGTFSINDQLIKAFFWCQKDPEIKGSATFVSITPETELGQEFLRKSFESDESSVFFEYEGIKANISTVGFKKAWDSVESGAI
ncbi:MAG: hypothetical protein H9917_10040 [Candidatus Oceanisphaera merdipullorum]|nr:hypothetical protein [Candidatus Oceanisphaera merdipullorum]